MIEQKDFSIARGEYIRGLKDAHKIVSQKLDWGDTYAFQDYKNGFEDAVEEIAGLLEELIDNETNA